MNLMKIIFGVLLLGLIPTHWFIGGLTVGALGGSVGVFIIALWIALFIGGISLIVSGIADEKPTVRE